MTESFRLGDLKNLEFLIGKNAFIRIGIWQLINIWCLLKDSNFHDDNKGYIFVSLFLYILGYLFGESMFFDSIHCPYLNSLSSITVIVFPVSERSWNLITIEDPIFLWTLRSSNIVVGKTISTLSKFSALVNSTILLKWSSRS